ncbi:hypothetical protein [Thermovenabulum sp.]|uniref:hypothetical protein n=1 Tax=Thermovenabulum sp. TaxID=3100335 RepID=UPI003C7C9065
MIVETTINAQTKNYLKERQLADMIKNMKFDEDYIVQIFNFFTDVHPQDMVKFMVKYGITEKELISYYENFIKEYYPNKYIEELIKEEE